MVCSHRFGAVSSPAGAMRSPDGGKVWLRSHRSTLRYAEVAASHTRVVMADSFHCRKYAGVVRFGHDVEELQYRSNGASRYSAAVQPPTHRPALVNHTCTGALPEASDPARVP